MASITCWMETVRFLDDGRIEIDSMSSEACAQLR